MVCDSSSWDIWGSLGVCHFKRTHEADRTKVILGGETHRRAQRRYVLLESIQQSAVSIQSFGAISPVFVGLLLRWFLGRREMLRLPSGMSLPERLYGSLDEPFFVDFWTED